MRSTLPPPPMTALPPRLLFAGLALVVVAAGVWVLRTFDPNAAGNPFPPCVFHVFTGLWCPGCGITRALHALAHFDLAGALAMNPLVIVALPLLAALALHTWTPWRVLPARLAQALSNGYGWIAVFVVFGVLRNLPWWPFAWLAPG